MMSRLISMDDGGAGGRGSHFVSCVTLLECTYGDCHDPS